MPVKVETFSQMEEAGRALSSNSRARYFGGGTLLMRAVNEADQSFDTIIRLNDPALGTVRTEGDRIVIGSGVTMAQIAAHRDLQFLAPVARMVGGPAIRSAATVGGNLFAPPPYGDFATALMALGATILFGGQSSSPMTIEDFMRERERYRSRIVQCVSVQRLRDPKAFVVRKVSRIKPKGVAVMTMAAHLPRQQGDGLRVAYGNMGPTPLRVTAVERALEAGQLDETAITRAQAVATEGLDPPTDELATQWYRREVAPVHLKRLLLERTRS